MSVAVKSVTGLSRRFLNLIVDNRIHGIKSLCSMDLEHLFSFPTTSPQTTQAPSADAGYMKNEVAAALTMDSIQIRPPHFNFQASTLALSEQGKIDCFPLANSTVICADHLGRAFELDAYWGLVGTMPSLHKSKRMPISIFVPKSDADGTNDHNGCGSSLFVMERIPEPECLTAAPKFAYLSMMSAPICLDTENFTWREVGKWMLPFHGKVEYVPELNFWFGLSAKDRHLAAADLSSILTMNSEPQFMDLGKDPPEEWKECKDSQLINLGAGMFSITRFFRARTLNDNFGDKSIDQEFAIFTGVEVVAHILNPNGNANSSDSEKVELRMTPHKSRCHTTNDTIIGAVF
ncbi:hypothetical protein QOZ80_7AG0577220 [Eleusine coracana subsp. coracana]|nr:hypothetical protein QOZ80_7AG0577220 [Eleusine coracana subsp. coracana]